MTPRDLILRMLAYGLTSLFMVGVFLLFRFPYDPLMILTGLALWPDVSLLAGFGRMTKAQSAICRAAGLLFIAVIVVGRPR